MRPGISASLLAGLWACSGTGCRGAREATPIIHVAPAAAKRWTRWLARDGHAGAAGSPRARVRVMTGAPRDRLSGPNAIGRPGDLLIENDEVVFVIDQLGSNPGFAETGGNLVDAADARVRQDELGQVFTYFGTFPR
ncbi:MAG: hypothetical protein JOZ69_08460, partial [Myxococcales bacterium]|nr:hypothetical protein [Myxococcales bacterium]